MGEGTDPTTVPVEELNKLQSDYDDLTKKHDDLKAEHDALKDKHDKLEKEHKTATEKLTAFVKVEKDQVIKDILEKAKEKAWDQKDLEEMDLEQLKLILKAVDSAKATAPHKGIRATAGGEGIGEGGLTVGDLFHTPFENPSVQPGGAE